MKKIAILFFILIFVSGFVCADYLVKTNNHKDASSMMGSEQPASDTMSQTWIGKNVIAIISDTNTMITDLNKKVMYAINHGDKSYVEMSLPLNIDKYLGEQAKQMKMMMAGMTAVVAPTKESKKIGKWNCTAYDVKMSMSGMVDVTIKMWTTKDVPFDFKMIQKMMKNIMQAQGGMAGDSLMKEMSKVDGFQIYSDVTVNAMGNTMKSNSKVIEIVKKSPPAGIYSVPAGYTKKETLPSQRGM